MAKASNKNHKNASNSADKISSNGKRKRTRKTIPRESPQPRSSTYRGVTRHRWTGRYEAHLWDKNCWNESQSKKGRQVYLGAYDNEEAAAHAYDLAALKYWGEETLLNFPLTTYEIELKEMEGLSREEYIGSLRRKSSGFSRGVSKYRGVARHHHNGRWEARIGRVLGNKYLYLGTYATQEEAATAYDMAAIEYRGLNAVTNFDLSRYIKWLRPNQSNTDHPQPNPNPNTDPTSNPNPDIGFSFLHLLTQSSTSAEMAGPAHPKPDNNTSASSALGILLQSSKFKEMLEQTTSLDNPSSPSEQDAPRRSFPDDIQTSFEFHETSSFTEEHDIIFGDLNSSFASQMLHCELDA